MIRGRSTTQGNVLLYVLLAGIIALSAAYVGNIIVSEHRTGTIAKLSEDTILVPEADITASSAEPTVPAIVSTDDENVTEPPPKKEGMAAPVATIETPSAPVAQKTEPDLSEVQALVSNTTVPLIVPDKYASSEVGALDAQRIIHYTNEERIKEGIRPLLENSLLDQAALAKVNHMFDEQYFEHVAPISGLDVVHWVGTVGYSYIVVGENLAMGGFKSEEEMVDAWMNSPGHRENILKTSYQEIGVAVGKGRFGDREVWMGVQVFGTPTSACPTINAELLVTIEANQASVDAIEKTLNVLSGTIQNAAQPETQEEYEVYVALVGEYNSLVARHDALVATLTENVTLYNAQVQAYNSCVTSM